MQKEKEFQASFLVWSVYVSPSTTTDLLSLNLFFPIMYGQSISRKICYFYQLLSSFSDWKCSNCYIFSKTFKKCISWKQIYKDSILALVISLNVTIIRWLPNQKNISHFFTTSMSFPVSNETSQLIYNEMLYACFV